MLNQKGVTLIEVVTCLVVISILATVSAPAIAGYRERMSLRAETRNLVGWLQQAKIEAIKTNSFVVLGVDDKQIFVFVDDGRGAASPGDWIMQPEEKQIMTSPISNGIVITSKFTNNKMRFSGSTGIKAGRFYLTDGSGNQMQVVLSRLGRIRVERTEGIAI